jgi:hypothetical protein
MLSVVRDMMMDIRIGVWEMVIFEEVDVMSMR